MITFGILEKATGACEPTNPGRKRFTVPNQPEIRDLVVPNYLEDRDVRWLVDHGRSLKRAYQEARISSIYPTEALVPCIFDALKVKYLDKRTGEMKLTGGNFGCLQYFACYEQYIKGIRAYPDTSGRMEIMPGLYAPSPAEDTCIRKNWLLNGDIRAAYDWCGATDIFPNAPGAETFLNNAIRNVPGKKLYTIIRDLFYTAGPEEPPTDDEPPAHTPHNGNGFQYSWLLIAGIGVLLLSRFAK